MTDLYTSEKARHQAMAAYETALQHWPVASERRFIETHLGATFVLSCGPQKAPPLMLLHGAQANAASWRGHVQAFASRFRVHLIDIVGEAGMSAPSRPPLADSSHAQWLEEVMQALGLANASFAGISLGAWLVLDLAVRKPQRVHQMALMCPPGIGRQKAFVLRALPWLLLGPRGRRRIRRMVFGDMPTITTPGEQAVFDMVQAIDQGFRPRTEKIPVFTDAQLQALCAPLLVLAGGRDVMIDSEHTACRLARLQPQADMRLLRDQPHYVRGQTNAMLEHLVRHEGAHHDHATI